MVLHDEPLKMKKNFYIATLSFACMLCFSMPLFAKEFKSVKVPSILYDAPNIKASRIAIAPSGMPVEILVKLDNGFVKVRDSEGSPLWIEQKNLDTKKFYILERSSSIRDTANTKGRALVNLGRGVLVEQIAPPQNGWIKVKHRDGIVGFINTTDVWGE